MVIGIAACSQNQSPVEKIFIDQQKLDSIRSNSDSGYTRTIGAAEYYKAEQYINLKDDITTKIMKDTADHVIGFVQYKKGKKIDFAEFYTNGQLKAKLLLDEEGQFNGYARYYYEDGRVKSDGYYLHGLYTSEWKNYDVSGILESVDRYDEKGQHIGNSKK